MKISNRLRIYFEKLSDEEIEALRNECNYELERRSQEYMLEGLEATSNE